MVTKRAELFRNNSLDVICQTQKCLMHLGIGQQLIRAIGQNNPATFYAIITISSMQGLIGILLNDEYNGIVFLVDNHLKDR